MGEFGVNAHKFGLGADPLHPSKAIIRPFHLDFQNENDTIITTPKPKALTGTILF